MNDGYTKNILQINLIQVVLILINILVLDILIYFSNSLFIPFLNLSKINVRCNFMIIIDTDNDQLNFE